MPKPKTPKPHDEALLDMIAMEMGAPDPISDEEIAEAVAEQARLQSPLQTNLAQPAGPHRSSSQRLRPSRSPCRSGRFNRRFSRPHPAPSNQHQRLQPAPAAPVEMSLGSTIIASGMLRKPAVPANDPLAPIRRMSQAEKIAFFS